MGIAPGVNSFKGMKITGLLTKEKPYVVDDSGSFIGALVDWLSWARRRRTNSPVAGSGARGANYQSGLWSKSYLISDHRLAGRNIS
jgi:hypothetical protein